ncbi:hypothetical protein ACF0H5_023593 [Mactra antiquata]
MIGDNKDWWDRHRNYSDHRYPTTTTSTVDRNYTTNYTSDILPRYRSSHGYTEFPREPYNILPYTATTTPTLTNNRAGGIIHSNIDSTMSKYNKNYDVRNTTDYTTRSYDSPRYTDRGKLNLDKFDSDVTSPPFEFGVSYKSPRTQDISTKNHDISTKSYDRITKIDDVTTRRSPIRNTSISDRDVANKHPQVDPPIDRRRRVGSNDSTGSHSSDRSAGTEDKSLLSALKHRYQENAEKQYEDPTGRSPFSSWRRSGNFEEVTSSIAPEAQKEKTKSLERKTFHGDSDRTYSKHEGHRAERSRSSSKDKERSRAGAVESSAVSEKKGEMSTDDLIYNFRQALCRHALSEQEKSQEQVKVSDSSAPRTNVEDDATAQRLERLRAARAKIHEQRNSDKVNSLSFATEYKVEKEKDRRVKSRSGSASSDRSSERDRGTSDDVSKTDELKHRQSSKLARQKLVSDDLRAKYMIKRDDEKEASTSETSPSDSLSRKRSDRRQRLKEHTEMWSKEKEKDTSVERKDVPSMEDMLLGSTQQETKASSVAKKFAKVDHSSPFGSVYSRPSSVVVTTTSPLTSSASSTITTTTTTLLASPTDARLSETTVNEISEVKPAVEEIKPVETTPVETTKHKPRSDRKYKKYNQKSKSLELGLLAESAKQEEPIQIETVAKDDSSIATQPSDDLTQLDRQERIAKYKEERRKQLKSIQDKFAAGEMPSLFLSSKSETDSPLTRSHSLKVETESRYTPSSSSVSRSRSLKEESERESDYSGRSSPMRDIPKVTPGLRLAEIGSQDKTSTSIHVDGTESSKKSDADKIIDKLQALKRLTKEQLQKSNQESKGSNVPVANDDVDIGQTTSYTSRALLADRVMEDTSLKDSGLTPVRDRVRSSSRETDSGRSDKMEQSRHRFGREPEQKKSYFEFGTVFTGKKEPKTDSSRKRSERSSSTEISYKEDQAKETVESSARVRRILPSIEDVLGTNGIETSTPEVKQDSSVDNEKVEKVTEEKSKEEIDKSVSVAEVQSEVRAMPEVKIMPEVKVVPEIKPELSKDEISKLHADEINKRKIAGNIERAKNMFIEGDKNAGAYEASRFELGTVYTPKKEQKPKVQPAPENVFECHDPPVFESTQQLKLNINSSQNINVPEKQAPSIVQKSVSSPDDNLAPLVVHSKVKTPPESIEVKDINPPTKIDIETVSKPPSSPRSERRRRAEQKFGKVSYRSNEAFEFGTTYSKKETKETPAVSKTTEKPVTKVEPYQTVKEKTPELAPETMKEAKKVNERQRTNKVVEPTSVTQQAPSLSYSKPDSTKVDIAANEVSRASGQTAEVPSSPRRMSPVRVAMAPATVKVASVQASTVTQPMNIETQPRKDQTEISAVYQEKEVKEIAKPVEKVTNIEMKVDKSPPDVKPKPEKKPDRPVPERQTSSTSLELKSPVEAQSVVSPQRTDVKFDRQSSTGSVEIKSAFDMHKRLVEEKIEEQSANRRSANIEDWSIDKGDKKNELFEMHKKQIEMKLETKREPVIHEKTIEKQDSDVFEMHKQQIKEKLELKYKPIEARNDPENPDFVMDERLESKEEKVRIEIEKLKKLEAEKQRRLELAAKYQLEEQPEKVETKRPVTLKTEERVRTKREVPQQSIKMKKEVPEHTKAKMEKAIMETSLDDILSKNVDYLSDMDTIQTQTVKDSKKKRPQSVHDQQKPKRSFKKKSGSRRSKSEERNLLKASESEEDGMRSEVRYAEGYQRSSTRVMGSREYPKTRRRRLAQQTL